MSSFSSSGTTKQAENNLGGISSQATNIAFPAATKLSNDSIAQGNNLFKTGGSTIATGQGNINTGTGFLNTIANGNQANTTALLRPNIDAIRANNASTLSAINTLMPRGGGRYGALFSQALQPQSQIQNLFSNARNTAVTALPQIGLQQQQLGLAQQGLGANLFGIGNSALSTGVGALNSGTGASSSLAQAELAEQQRKAGIWSGLGSGIFGLATLPFGGAPGGLLGKGLGSLFPASPGSGG